jgi:hypothetical protein
VSLPVISADNHIIEHRDAFVRRMPAAPRERAPRVIRAPDGGDGWSWNGGPVERSFGIEAVAGQGGQGSKTFKPPGLRWEILPGNYDGAAHLADQARDGVDAAVVFPSVAIQAYAEPDCEAALAVAPQTPSSSNDRWSATELPSRVTNSVVIGSATRLAMAQRL